MNKQSAPYQLYHLSNAITYVSVLAALLSPILTFSLSSPFVMATALYVCFIADLFDGKFSRLFKNRPQLVSEAGVQLDSLADALAFGLSPTICLFLLTQATATLDFVFFVLAALVYLLSSISRLAYYNIVSSNESYFIGLPTTLNGILWLAVLLLPLNSYVLVSFLLISALLMVSPFKIPRPKIKGYLFLVFSATGLWILHLMRWLA